MHQNKMGCALHYIVFFLCLFDINYNNFKMRVLEYYPNFYYDIENKKGISRTDIPTNPCVLTEITDGIDIEKRYVLSEFPDFKHNTKFNDIQLYYQFSKEVSDYISYISIIENNVVTDKVLKVNSPV